MAWEPSQFVRHISSAGDLAVVLLGYVAGFLLHVHLAPLTAAPGMTAALFSAGALGLKKTGEAVLGGGRRKLRARSHALAKTVGSSALSKRIAEARELWRMGLMTDPEFDDELRDVLAEYRQDKALHLSDGSG